MALVSSGQLPHASTMVIVCGEERGAGNADLRSMTDPTTWKVGVSCKLRAPIALFRSVLFSLYSCHFIFTDPMCFS
jgi:hypothetical protein